MPESRIGDEGSGDIGWIGLFLQPDRGFEQSMVDLDCLCFKGARSRLF